MSNAAYEELLCYQGFDVGVDQLLRAYLDTRLVEMRDEADYDAKAGEIRNELARGSFLDASRAWAYLYWFDIRAAFWKGRPLDAQTKELIIPSAKLLKLYDAAKNQQAKLPHGQLEYPSRDVLLFLSQLLEPCA
jgi:hypothetical protein